MHSPPSPATPTIAAARPSVAPGTLWRIEGELLELLGFAGMNVAPLGELSPIGATRWRGRTLAAGSELQPEQYLLARNRQYQLEYQSDGDLVLYRLGSGRTWKPNIPDSKLDESGTWELERTALWRTGKPGNAGCVRLQASDGNLVVYRTATGTEPAWAAHEHGAICGAEHDAFDVAASLQTVSRQHDHASEYSGSSLVLEDDGRLEIRSRSGVLLWRAPRKIVGELPAGEWLFRADNFVSHDGTHSFVNDRDWAMAQLGADGHLRVYGRRSLTPLWSTEQSGGKSANTRDLKLVVESNAEIAVRDGAATLWSSYWARGSSGSRLDPGQWFESPGGEYRLVLQQHGDLVDLLAELGALELDAEVRRQLGVALVEVLHGRADRHALHQRSHRALEHPELRAMLAASAGPGPQERVAPRATPG